MTDYNSQVLAELREHVSQSHHDDWWLVFEGDWGGQIFCTVPIHLVGDKAKLFDLLSYLDTLCWGCNEGDGSNLYPTSPSDMLDRMRQDHCPPDILQMIEEDRFLVPGGMGGGELLTGEVWLHPELKGEESYLTKINVTEVQEQVKLLLDLK